MIYFKDNRIEPVVITGEEGAKVKKWWLNEKVPQDSHISLKNWSGFKGDIRNINFVGEEQHTDYHEEYFKQVTKEYWDERKAFLVLPANEKGKRLGMAELLYYHLTGEKIPESMKNEVICRQIAFFEQNKTRMFVNPVIFKDLFPIKSPLHNESKMGVMVRENAFRQIENLLVQDNFASRNEQKEIEHLESIAPLEDIPF